MEEPKSNPVDGEVLSGPAQPITAAEIVAPLGERMPPVTEGQTNAPLPAETPKETKPNGPTDRRGVVFDRAKHAVDENGNAKANKDGFWYSNKLGKHGKSGSTVKPPLSGDPVASPVSGGIESERAAPTFATPDKPRETEKQIATDEFDLMAEVVLQSAYGPVMILFSEDARPNAEEHAALKQSYAAWFRHKGIKDFSPGWGAVITTVAIAVKKTEKPTVRERAALLFLKVKGYFNKSKKV